MLQLVSLHQPLLTPPPSSACMLLLHPQSSQPSGQESATDPAAVAVTLAWDPMKEVQELAGTVQSKDEDHLQLLESIGTGGFGTVYRGRWRNLDVAVKTVLFTSKQGAGDSPEKQVIKEAAVCSSVIHPNVVRGGWGAQTGVPGCCACVWALSRLHAVQWQAIKEAVVCSSAIHPNVVRAVFTRCTAQVRAAARVDTGSCSLAFLHHTMSYSCVASSQTRGSATPAQTLVPQVATYHYDIRPVRAVAAEGSGLQIRDPVQSSDWKMYLVQELCHASLADALVSSFFHNKTSGLPYLVSAMLRSCSFRRQQQQ